MMKRLLYIILITCSPLIGQGDSLAVSGGGLVTSGGGGLIITKDMIPVTPVIPEPDPDPFTGILYKHWTFAEISLGAMSTARWQTLTQSDGVSYVKETTATDYTIEMSVNGQTDTVEAVFMGDDNEVPGESGDAISIRGEIQFAGYGDASEDTKIRAVYKKSIMFAAWPYLYSNGGKLGGFGGYGVYGDEAIDGGVFACECDPPPSQGQEFCPTDGFSVRINFREPYFGCSADSCDVITYSYVAEMSRDCVNPPTFGIARMNYTIDYIAGVWYDMTLAVTLNDVGSSNGIVELFKNNVCAISWTGVRIRDDAGVYISEWIIEYFAGGDPDDAWEGGYVYTDDHYLFDDLHPTAYGVGGVMTNIPEVGTPNVTASITGVKGMFDENYLAIQPAQKDDLWLIPADVWGDKWKGYKP
ncbi:MAG: hypothetical protein V2B15_08570 [Bacteroidota bacterium]